MYVVRLFKANGISFDYKCRAYSESQACKLAMRAHPGCIPSYCLPL